MAIPVGSFGTLNGEQSIGGVAIGAVGTGIYGSHTMVGGDDFNTPLDIVQINSPLAKYFSTKVYSAGGRRNTSNLATGYDCDPYFTGAQDSNRGVPIASVSDVMTQANSLLTLKGRIATTAESALLESFSCVDAMIHGGGYSGVSAPCIIEFSFALSNHVVPGGSHLTTWMENSSPLSTALTADGMMEFDMPEQLSASSSGNATLQINYNTHGTTTTPASTPNIGGSVFPSDQNQHVWTGIFDASAASFYIDGTAHGSLSGDMTQNAKPYDILVTNHIITSDFNQSDYTTLGNTGISMIVDWWRVWVPTSSNPKIIQPLLPMGTGHKTAFNTADTYTFPSLATLWPASVTDYCQGIKKEDFEPGSSTEGTGQYIQWPSGYSWNGTTRVLSYTESTKPGRIHISAMPYLAGGVYGYAWRDWIDIGPHITTTSITGTGGSAVNYDLYFDCDCGTLSPGKVITVTGLPSGATLVQNATFYGISWATAVSGTYPLVIGVTNAVGQAITKNVNMVIS